MKRRPTDHRLIVLPLTVEDAASIGMALEMARGTVGALHGDLSCGAVDEVFRRRLHSDLGRYVDMIEEQIDRRDRLDEQERERKEQQRRADARAARKAAKAGGII